MAPMGSSRMSQLSHSSTVATVSRLPCSFSMVMGRTSKRLLVTKFSMPFFVLAIFTRSAFAPVVFCRLPSVMNFSTGPFARANAVRKGASTSSACFMVGAVVSCWVVFVLAVIKYACKNSRYMVFAAERVMIRYCFVTSRFFMRLVS